MEEGGGEVGVVGGFVEDGSDAGAVLEFDFEGAEVVGGGVDVEVPVRSHHVAVADLPAWEAGAEQLVEFFLDGTQVVSDLVTLQKQP